MSDDLDPIREEASGADATRPLDPPEATSPPPTTPASATAPASTSAPGAHATAAPPATATASGPPPGYVPIAAYVPASSLAGGPPRATLPSWWKYAAVALVSLLLGGLLGAGLTAVAFHHGGDGRANFRHDGPGRFGPGYGRNFGPRGFFPGPNNGPVQPPTPAPTSPAPTASG